MPKKPTEGSSTMPQPSFETALAELETLVQRMEVGELSLEDSLQEFERGIQLTRLCQEALNNAEQRVKLINANGTTSDFSGQGNN